YFHTKAGAAARQVLADHLAALEQTASEKPMHDWPMFRGNANRNGQGMGGAPFLEARWRVSMLPPSRDHKSENTKPCITNTLRQAANSLVLDEQPILPGFFPIAVDAKIIYRSYDGIYTLNAGSGQLEWMATTDGSFDFLVRDAGKRFQVDQWRTAYQ